LNWTRNDDEERRKTTVGLVLVSPRNSIPDSGRKTGIWFSVFFPDN